MQKVNFTSFYGCETWSDTLREEYELRVDVARMRDTRNAYKIVVGKHLGDLGRHKCEDDIEMALREIGCDNVD
jgi:hypothetical protein